MSGFVPRTVYFIFSATCAACEVAEPEFDRFLREHPHIWAFKLDADSSNPSPLAKRAKFTPTYVIVEAGQVVWSHAGPLTAAQLKKAVLE